MAEGDIKGFDAEEFLQCNICLDDYQSPKALPCLHTYCQECIQSHINRTAKKGKFSCPMCRRDIEVPDNGADDFPTNFMIENLREATKGGPGKRMEGQNMAGSSAKKKVCDSCNEGNQGSIEAVAFCSVCKDHLCQPCVEAHKRTKLTKAHELKEVVTDTKRNPNSLSEGKFACHFHPDTASAIYCRLCNRFQCMTCFQENCQSCHPEMICVISDSAVVLKQEIVALRNELKAKGKSYGELLKGLYRDKNAVTQKKDLLLENINAHYDKQVQNLLREQKATNAKIEKAYGVCITNRKDAAEKIEEDMYKLESNIHHFESMATKNSYDNQDVKSSQIAITKLRILSQQCSSNITSYEDNLPKIPGLIFENGQLQNSS